MFAADLVYQGLELALIGMGSVFTFLTVLVLGTTLMSWIVQRFALEAPPTPRTGRPGVAGKDDGEVVAAITAAIRAHRSRRH